ncbi:DUF2789 domain-containing protein [Ferribacterium limneticum]|uniref:DUF2789 domain-containing protein n=1 Tax=Ferribacterium limneticum TaxID=76259 RepID=UPI001CF8765F|nr:DUF2789 domain-containing protein [Ferribacterium limneticum]UCV21664.1 DUF2789 domain-containing protein [Ferribacterium limneticum]
MERPVHSMNNLFAQLGKPSDDDAIERFIETYRPLAGAMQLHEASFWSASQACFLHEALLHDADWAEVADKLNVELHARH